MLYTHQEKEQLRALRATVFAIVTLIATLSFDSASPQEDRTALFAAATAAYRHCHTSKALASDDAICLFGHINDAMRTAFDEGLKPTTKFLVIESPGGLVTPAMDIGLQMMTRGIDVVVANKCLSSCANYIFLAAPHKFLINKAIVGWHGSPASYPKEKLTTLSERAQGRVAEQLNRHNRFFATLRDQGVREDLVNVPPPNLKPGSSIWTYSEKRLEEEFGVRNVFRLNVEVETNK